MDAYVGGRLKLRRTQIGMSQERLGQAVGLTFQQIQKYEKGANRIGASRLYQFASVLGVPPAFFFEGYDPAAAALANGHDPEAAEAHGEPPATREGTELLRAFARIGKPAVRRRVLELLRAMATEEEAGVAGKSA